MPDFYGNIVDADDYHSDRGGAIWAAASTPTKQAALLIASGWIDARYGGSFPGYPTGKRAQLRAWPRSTAYDKWGDYIPTDTIPYQVEQATYEVALRQVQQPGSLYVDWIPGQDKKSVSIAGAVSVTYAGAVSYFDAQLHIGGIDTILGPILDANSGVSIYSGASGRV